MGRALSLLGAFLISAIASLAQTFTTQPANASATDGGDVTLTAAATDEVAVTYQWYRDGVAIAGATDAELNLTGVGVLDTGYYHVVATGSGDVSSEVVRLDVFPSGSPVSLSPNPSVDFALQTEGAQITDLLALSDGRLAIAGSFVEFDGHPTNGVVVLNAAGEVDTSFSLQLLDGGVNEMSEQPDGRILISGSLQIQVGDRIRSGRFRINSDGSPDTSFDPDGLTSGIYAVDAGGLIYSSVPIREDGSLITSIPRVNSAGELDPSYAPMLLNDGDSPFVRDIEIQNGLKVLVAAEFETVNGQAQRGIARLQASGELDDSFVFSLPQGSVEAIEIDGDGSIWLAVNQSLTTEGLVADSSYDGDLRRGIVRLGADGTFLSSTVIDMAFIVTMELTPDGGAIVGGEGLEGSDDLMVHVLADGSVDPTFEVTANARVNDLAVDSTGRIVFAGPSFFGSIQGSERQSIARVNSAGVLDTAFDPAMTSAGFVTDFVLQEGGIVVGGVVTRLNGAEVGPLFRLNYDGSVDSAFDIGSGPNGPVNAVKAYPDGRLLVTGGFTTWDGFDTGVGVVRLDADGAHDQSFVVEDQWYTGSFGVLGTHYALLPRADGGFLASGWFGKAGGTFRIGPDGIYDDSFQANFNASISGPWSTAQIELVDAGGGQSLGGGFGVNVAPSSVFMVDAEGTAVSAFSPDSTIPGIVAGFAAVGDEFFVSDIGSSGQGIWKLLSDGSVDPSFVTPETELRWDGGLNRPIMRLFPEADGGVVGVGNKSIGREVSLRTPETLVARFNADGSHDTSFGIYGLPGLTITAAERLADGNFLIGARGRLVLTRESPVGAISSQPDSQTVVAGSGASFSVAVDGVGPFTYQWYRDGVLLGGETSATLTVSNVQPGDTGSYYAVVSNPGGTVQSANALLAVNTLPAITQQPSAASVTTGDTVILSVAASGIPAPTYQWRKDGVDIPGETAATLNRPAAQVGDSGSYSVVVSNVVGDVTSNAVTVTVAPIPPTIVLQPSDQAAFDGSPVTMSVETRGSPAPTYQWRKDGVNIPGATGSSFTITAVSAADAGLYDVVVTNVGGSVTSSAGSLTIATAASQPIIVTQPKNQTSVAGSDVTLSVESVGVPTPTYQWHHNGVALAGETAASLTLSAITVEQAGAYTVTISNTEGSLDSRSAQVSVLSSSYAGIYFGSFGPGRGEFAIYVRLDNTGTFVGYDKQSGLFVSGSVTVGANGQFTLTTTAVSASAPAFDSGIPFVARNEAPIVLNFLIGDDGNVTGTVEGVDGLNVSGAEEPSSGSTAEVAGLYEANAGDAATVMIVSPSGKVVALSRTASGADAGSGTVDSSGQVSVNTVNNGMVTAAVSASTREVAASVTDETGAMVEMKGGDDQTLAKRRMTNISTRAMTGMGERSTIAGLVIGGQQPKQVLIRAVGPALTEFGLGNPLLNPSLTLYQGSEVLAVADRWSDQVNANSIARESARVGAFALGNQSADAAILTTLEPGAYTAVATDKSGHEGVVLVEVYDLSPPTLNDTMVNVSTRSYVGAGDSALIAGFVITGDVAKQVLVRAAGPALANLGVNDAVGDPQLKIVRSDETVGSNDNWEETDGGSAISAAATQVGAFEFESGSRDAALLMWLDPGTYTVLVTGVNGASGVGLVEVYEVN